MKKMLLVALICASVSLADSFAASGEIRGNAEGMRNIAVWQRNNRRMAIFDAGNFLSGDSAQDVGLCSLMQRVNYSAIALGTRELRHTEAFWRAMNERFSLPILATNVRLKSGERIFERIRTVQYDSGEKYAIISIFSVSSAQISPDFEVEDPQTVLDLVIPQIPRDHKIVLISHGEPSLTDSLITKNPRIDFGVQGYRKETDEPFVLSGTKIILQFGEEGRSIAVLRRGAVRWRRFVQSDTPRSDVSPEKPKKVEIFSMSGCEYSKDAIREFLPFMQDSLISLKVSFAGDFDRKTRTLSPALENGCLREEKIYLAVQDLLPEKFRDFLFLALNSQSLAQTEKIAENIGLSRRDFERWNKKKGEKTLAQNYKRADALGINSCPTIMVDNRKIKKTPEYENEKTANVKIILPEYETPNLSVELVLAATLSDFSDFVIDTLDLDDPKSGKLLKRFEIDRLPALILNDEYAWDWGEIPDGVYYERELRENELVVIADSATAETVRSFFNENPAQKPILLTDDETDGWIIWYENRNLISGKDVCQAKNLMNIYGAKNR